MYCQARFAVIAGLVWIAGKMMKKGDEISDGFGRGKCLVLFSVEEKCKM